MSEHKQEESNQQLNDEMGLITSLVTTYIANGASESFAPIDMRGFAGGMVKIPAAWTAADLAFKICESIGGTYVPLKDDAGSLVKITSITTDASFWYRIPEDVFSARFVKLYSVDTSDDSAEAQGAVRDIYVSLKG